MPTYALPNGGTPQQIVPPAPKGCGYSVILQGGGGSFHGKIWIGDNPGQMESSPGGYGFAMAFNTSGFSQTISIPYITTGLWAIDDPADSGGSISVITWLSRRIHKGSSTGAGSGQV